MQKYFLVGEISKILKIPRSTLRYNYRCYSRAQIITIKKINTMRKLGLTLEEIKIFFSEKTDDRSKEIEKDKELIANVLERINDDIEKLKMVKKDLEEHLKRMEITSKMPIGIPFIEEIKNVSGIKIYEKENNCTNSLYSCYDISCFVSWERSRSQR